MYACDVFSPFCFFVFCFVAIRLLFRSCFVGGGDRYFFLVLLHTMPLFVFVMFICANVRFLPPSGNASPPQSGALRNSSGRGPGSSRRALALTQAGATSAAVAAELFPLEAPRPRPHAPTLAAAADVDSTDVFLAAERAATVATAAPL
jgi:hypothetical protein